MIQTAFGIKVDSLNDPTNPIITNGRKVFQTQFNFVDLIIITIIHFAPRFAKLFNLEVHNETTKFFSKMSNDIIEQKRLEYAKTKSFAKANNFIEFLLEAEEEGRKFSENENDVDAKKHIKCKFVFS